MEILDWEKYRWFFASSGNLVISGKNELQNEHLVKGFIGSSNVILHTSEPGSPFSIIQKEPSKRDIEEATVFCACFSQQWKQKMKRAEVHVFLGKDVFKDKGMKIGTFGVLKFKTKSAELKLKLAIQKGKLRAVPLSVDSEVEIPEIVLMPGSMMKGKAVELISERLKKQGFDFKKEPIEQAIPSGGFGIEIGG